MAKSNSLPIRRYEADILQSVRTNPITIVVGDTGSGKTTQLSQILDEAGFAKKGCRIGVTQPRRIGAVSVARRVAQEKNVDVGNEVGYMVRFEDRTSRSSRIIYMTGWFSCCLMSLVQIKSRNITSIQYNSTPCMLL